MVNQQEENFTKIGNDILEYIPKVKLNGTQRGIITVIWRYTYGFHREDHDFSLGFLSEATCCDRQQVKRELDKLIKDKVLVITKEANFNNSRKIAFNRDFSKWAVKGKVSAEKSTVSELADTTVSELADTTVSELAYQERNIKENIKKDNSASAVDIFFEEIWALYPNKKGKSAIKAATRRKLHLVGKESLEMAIKRYKEELKLESWKHPMNGSTFFNGRYEDYLETDTEPEEQSEELEIKRFDPNDWQ